MGSGCRKRAKLEGRRRAGEEVEECEGGEDEELAKGCKEGYASAGVLRGASRERGGEAVHGACGVSGGEQGFGSASGVSDLASAGLLRQYKLYFGSLCVARN